MRLSIIIVSWNTCKLLATCLASVQREREDLAPTLVETFVVDNASSDGSVQMVRNRFPCVRLIENAKNVGFAAANNQAISSSSGDWVLLLNSDAELSGQSLRRLIDFGAAHEKIAVIGCKLTNPDGSFQAAGNRFSSTLVTLAEGWGVMGRLTHNPYYPSDPPWCADQTKPCGWVGGACLLVRRAAIEKVGLLDEVFFMNAEEMDWCYRMWQHGWEVWYVHDAEVVHIGGASADRRSASQRLRLYEGKVRFVSKHYGRWAGKLVRLNFRLASLCKATGYQLAHLVTGRPSMQRMAASHWPVVWRKSWM